jgi:predicted ATPase
VEYLGRAGHQALLRSANADAIVNLSMAVELLQKLPDNPKRLQEELNLQLALGPASIAIYSWAAPEVERAFLRVRELCERMGDPPEVSSALFGLYAVYHVRGQSLWALDLAKELLKRAESNDDRVLLMCAHLALGDTLFELGEYLSAKEHFDFAISMYDPERHRALAFGFIGLDILVNCLSYSTNALWYLGYPDQALKRGNEALAVARGLSHPHSLAFAENLIGNLRIHRREVQETKNSADRLVALAAKHGFAMWAGLGKVQFGWATAADGQTESGIAMLREGLVAFSVTGAEIGRPYWLSLLAEACLKGDRLDEAQIVLTEALAAANNNENRGNESETSRLRGELLLRQNESNAAEAQKCFERALAVARKQRAKSLELRATMSLARLLASQGRRDEARTMLADIYHWFTEGFDTADLKDAKALLDQLDSKS